MIPDLKGKVCVVTGASRGVGRGVALGLLEAGATVHITGRTLHDGEPPGGLDRAGSLTSVLDAASAMPGICIAHRVDHSHDEETEAVLHEVIEAEGRIDILVNNAWPGYERMVEGDNFTWVMPFWDQPMWRWDAMIDTGVRAAYCASRVAAATMVRQRHGLIVNISFWAAQMSCRTPSMASPKRRWTRWRPTSPSNCRRSTSLRSPSIPASCAPRK